MKKIVLTLILLLSYVPSGLARPHEDLRPIEKDSINVTSSAIELEKRLNDLSKMMIPKEQIMLPPLNFHKNYSIERHMSIADHNHGVLSYTRAMNRLSSEVLDKTGRDIQFSFIKNKLTKDQARNLHKSIETIRGRIKVKKDQIVTEKNEADRKLLHEFPILKLKNKLESSPLPENCKIKTISFGTPPGVLTFEIEKKSANGTTQTEKISINSMQAYTIFNKFKTHKHGDSLIVTTIQTHKANPPVIVKLSWLKDENIKELEIINEHTGTIRWFRDVFGIAAKKSFSCKEKKQHTELIPLKSNSGRFISPVKSVPSNNDPQPKEVSDQ